MLRQYLPYFIYKNLFGDRKQYGLKACPEDTDWQRWLELYPQIYEETQRSGFIQRYINNIGYTVLNNIPLEGKTVAEIGPGGGHHLGYFKGTPNLYHVFDVCPDFFPHIEAKGQAQGMPVKVDLVKAYDPQLPAADGSVDVFLSFYSMEHLYPLESWLKEIFRVLKPNGILVGAIPTEGGILWGMGRYLLSKPHVKKKYNLDLNKIVCWEHPNMCDEIVSQFHQLSPHVRLSSFPFSWMPHDLSLVIKFIVQKDG